MDVELLRYFETRVSGPIRRMEAKVDELSEQLGAHLSSHAEEAERLWQRLEERQRLERRERAVRTLKRVAMAVGSAAPVLVALREAGII